MQLLHTIAKNIMCMAPGQNVDYVTNTNFSCNWHLTYVAWLFVIGFMIKKCSCIYDDLTWSFVIWFTIKKSIRMRCFIVD
jgi:hypothetical protein